MKKVTFALALITLVQFSTFAQPVATAANVNPNFTGEFYFAPATNFNPGSAGANQTWDFSNLQLTFAGTDTSIPVTGSAFANLFPNANYCYKFTGLGADRYYYHTVTAAKYEILSLALTATTGDNYSLNPRTFAVFPYTYNTVYNDTYRTTSNPAEVSVVATYDAYGTIILPFGTFNNVIRQKVVTNGVTNYNWFNVSPFFPILQTVLEQNSLGIVKNTTVLETETFSGGEMFSACPNPTQGFVTLNAMKSVGSPVEIEVFDLLGKRIIYSKENSLDEISLDFSPFTSGIYLVKVTNASDHTSQIRKIVRN
jgi:hypothetical protein